MRSLALLQQQHDGPNGRREGGEGGVRIKLVYVLMLTMQGCFHAKFTTFPWLCRDRERLPSSSQQNPPCLCAKLTAFHGSAGIPNDPLKVTTDSTMPNDPLNISFLCRNLK